MSLRPALPYPGAVVNYGYLWHEQARRGRVVPSKDRPCLVVAVLPPSALVRPNELVRSVYVMPITTRPPTDPDYALVLSGKIVRRCGLDASRRSTLVCDEVNRFEWRGPDVVGTPDGRSHFGEVGETVVRAALDLFDASGADRRRKITPRSS